VLLAAVLVVTLLAAGARASGGSGAEAVRAVVSIVPQEYFVRRIGGPPVSVEALVGPGQTPHAYEPTPRQMVRLAESSLYFSIGLPFETRLLSKIESLHSDLVVIDTAKDIRLRRFEGRTGHAHEKSNRADRDHGAAEAGLADPHTWLDPRLVKVQAAAICDALAELDPAHAEIYRGNLQVFLGDLDALHARIAEALRPLAGRNLYVFHPAFGYFADAYFLNQVAIESDGKEPGAKELAELMDAAKRDGVAVVFVQPQFSKRSAEALATEVGAIVLPLDPLAYDYIENLERMAQSVERGIASAAAE
jgi:zinc transport system substrate-binding protein